MTNGFQIKALGFEAIAIGPLGIIGLLALVAMFLVWLLVKKWLQRKLK